MKKVKEKEKPKPGSDHADLLGTQSGPGQIIDYQATTETSTSNNTKQNKKNGLKKCI